MARRTTLSPETMTCCHSDPFRGIDILPPAAYLECDRRSPEVTPGAGSENANVGNPGPRSLYRLMLSIGELSSTGPLAGASSASL